MVCEYGYEKRKDHRTESQTEGMIQYLTLATLVAAAPPCVVCFM